MQSDMNAFWRLTVEAEIAARDRERALGAERAKVNHQTEVVLAAMDTIVAADNSRRSRLTRLDGRKAKLLEWMGMNGYPGFTMGRVQVGASPPGKLRRIIHVRAEPIIEQRAILETQERGITLQGEFIERCIPRASYYRVVFPDQRDFDLLDFEIFFSEMFTYHGIDMTE